MFQTMKYIFLDLNLCFPYDKLCRVSWFTLQFIQKKKDKINLLKLIPCMLSVHVTSIVLVSRLIFPSENSYFSSGEVQRTSHCFGELLVYNFDTESVFSENVVPLRYCWVSETSSLYCCSTGMSSHFVHCLHFNSIQIPVKKQDSAFLNHQHHTELFLLFASWKTLPWAQDANATVLCQTSPGQPRTWAEWIYAPYQEMCT